ncbi:MAG: leucyl/phenylalanyl-tRNA--protein transferase, partial [Actinomycetia bacterium]|nr:leucyl/phenylalanyl-tRNA--protein transferase [Actinomycetes bacterium]
TQWSFPPLDDLQPDEDLVAVGADLEPGTILSAYSHGYFPMPVNRKTIGWFHPNPRGIIPLDTLHVSRSLRRSIRRYTTTVDRAFNDVLTACADPSRPMGWIDDRMMRAYSRLHQMGWAHSIEVWDDDGLAGGLYGLGIGSLFAGESMFHHRTDASKVALVHLVDILRGRPDALLDIQWVTPHLESLGATPISRHAYVERLDQAVGAVMAGDGEMVPFVPPQPDDLASDQAPASH